MLRFAVVTDIHYGFDRGYRLGSKAPQVMDDFVKAANDYGPDFVVELGDRISAKNKKEDEANMKALKAHFNKISAPTYSVIGNNDLRTLTRKDNETITGCPQETSYGEDINGYRLLFWNPNVNTDAPSGLTMENDDLDWLKNELSSTDKPIVLFSHIPLDNTPEDNEEAEKWDGAPFRSYYPEAQKIRDIIEQAGNVILCMAGHKHTNRHRQYGETHFVVHQSLMQATTKERTESRNAYSFIEIEDDTIKIIGHGHKQPSHELKINQKNTPDFNI